MTKVVLETIISGILVGGVYSLVALGIVVIYKSTKIVSFVQGGILLMGAVIGWGLMGPGGVPIGYGIVATLVACVVLGMGIDYFTLRPIIGQPILTSIMITIALSWAFNSIGILFLGGAEQYFPRILPEGVFTLKGLMLSKSLVFQFSITMLFFIVFTLFYKFANLGLAMRGTAEDQEVMQSLGVKVTRIYTYAWVIAAFFGGVCGILMGSTVSVNVGLESIGLKALAVVLIAGMESIPGAILVGPLIGILENLCVLFLDPLVGGGLGEIVPYVVMLFILFVKPYGLFGLERIERI